MIREEEDFFYLTLSYLARAHAQNVRHCEIFIDPQTHAAKGLQLKHILDGMRPALDFARKEYDISVELILCFLRHHPVSEAMDLLKSALPFRDEIKAVGLAATERGYPPELFESVYHLADQEGFFKVAHAGEEGPVEYIWSSLDQLKVDRIDHGNSAADDPALLKRLAEQKIPLTLCPLSNVRLQIIEELTDHPLRQLISNDLMVTINSDDPAYFDGYVNENYIAVAKAFDLSKKELDQLARNSFLAGFMSPERRTQLLTELENYVNSISL